MEHKRVFDPLPSNHPPPPPPPPPAPLPTLRDNSRNLVFGTAQSGSTLWVGGLNFPGILLQASPTPQPCCSGYFRA